MLLSIGVYWTIYGWKFAVGFILSIYVHEMGHVIQLRREGIAFLRPLTLAAVARQIDMHESTVSRVCSGKYVQTPRGVFERHEERLARGEVCAEIGRASCRERVSSPV